MTKEHCQRLISDLHATMMRWPFGTVCWHVATGDRLVVNSYKVHNGGVWVSACGSRGEMNFDTFELSQTKPADNEDGETWKHGAEP